jgi:homoserine O-acetyltransferase/O-succinyltransferase
MNISGINNFHYNKAFVLESGEMLPELTVGYHTYGKLNAEKNNVIWVCHALTANSDVADWWPGMVGKELAFDPEKYFIVCANILGSCYGTSGPLSINPQTQKPYFGKFPFITIRDMVNAHILLRQHLEIKEIQMLVGGSMGGYQALEWCIMEAEKIKNLLLLATSATESAWGIAIHTAQRLAIEADSSWQNESPDAGKKGLKAARAIGMLTYRNYEMYALQQTDPDPEKTENFKAESYINYQGDKLVNRFNAFSYRVLTKAMDSHNIARERGGKVEKVLHKIEQRTLIIGISSDILCPVQEQKFIHSNLPNATYIEINSAYGHDGFLVECDKISQCVKEWL